jgi:hypothetical protein
MSKAHKADTIYVNSVIQRWILDLLDNPPDHLNDALKAAFRRKFDLLENESQRIINPPPKKPRAPAVAEHAATGGKVIPVLEGLRHTSDVRKRSRRDG